MTTAKPPVLPKRGKRPSKAEVAKHLAERWGPLLARLGRGP